jgi:predicted transcriptional regulator
MTAMTLAIPQELEQKLLARARERRVSVESLVGEALHWYLQLEPPILEELEAWQAVRDEALNIVEESSS